MPRSRSTLVSEDIQTLIQLESSILTKTVRAHITMLRMLKENPALHLKDVSDAVGFSLTAVKRWWRTYEKAGLNALLKGPHDTKVQEAKDIEVLRELLRKGEFGSFDEIDTWMTERRDRRSKRKTYVPDSYEAVGRMYRKFMNSLPLTWDSVQWVHQFRQVLMELYPDIDQVALSYNAKCNLFTPGVINPDIAVMQYPAMEGNVIDVVDKPARHHHAERIIAGLRNTGHDLDIYQPPTSFEYYYEAGEYLGVMVLFRLKHRPPISQDTIDAINSLERFFIYILSDHVIRRQYYSPSPHTFLGAVDAISDKFGFTSQERRVIVLLAMGDTIDAISDKLQISLHTTQDYIKIIYRKANVRSFRELFGLYLAPK